MVQVKDMNQTDPHANSFYMQSGKKQAFSSFCISLSIYIEKSIKHLERDLGKNLFL